MRGDQLNQMLCRGIEVIKFFSYLRMLRNNVVDSKIAPSACQLPFNNHKDLPRATLSSKEVIQREEKYGAHNYDPVPVAICKGKGKLSILRANHFHD